MTADKPVVEVRARTKRASLAAIIDEQERQAKDLSRVSRTVEIGIMDKLEEIGRRLEELDTELAKIVAMAGTIRAINNRADQTLTLLQATASEDTAGDATTTDAE
ncbi:hypothetical protein [Leifsonia sp. NPDC058248]|uniref:hypothetical protein n=1 Tax=Leifsonia sp. NPDC058248 TaxID=3346402 RepID=UPI0036DEF977